MTGNNKFWRASLAGLASVAMLATMGVAASTASAANVEWTFEGNGLQFVQYGVKADSVKITDDGNGKLDPAEIDSAKRLLDPSDQSKLTGWYTTAAYGVADTAVQPEKSTATTVYAHYSADRYTVNFNGNGIVNGGASPVVLAYRDGALDKVSSWQVPSDDVAGDGKVLDAWKLGDTAVTPTSDLTSVFGIGDAQLEKKSVTLDATAADAYKVTFDGKDFGGKQWTLVVNNEELKTPTYKRDVKAGDAIGELPVAKLGDRQVTVWKTTNDATASAFGADTVPTGDVTLRPYEAAAKYTVTLEQNNGEDAQTVYVDPDTAYATPAAPEKAPSSDDYKVEFAGWYTDAAFKKAYKSGTKINGNITLYAKWNVTAAKLTFVPGYGDAENVEQWVSTGDAFTAPSLTRDGYTLTGWTPSGVASWLGAKLTVSGTVANGVVTGTIKGIRANGVSDTLRDRKFTAVWTANGDLKATLATMEGYVTTFFDGRYVKGSEQVDFTAASYDQYVLDYQDYLKDKGNPSSVADYKALVEKLAAIQAKLVETGDTPVYRLYNQWNGDHLYTTSKSEADSLAKLGWTAEGVQFSATGDRSSNELSAKTGHVTSHNFAEAVYRLYNPYNGEHLLTTDTAEVDSLVKAGWLEDNDGEPVFYASQGGATAVTRLFNPYATVGTHLYTTSDSEVASSVALGWLEDGVIFNAA